jgi:hypothetical protein
MSDQRPKRDTMSIEEATISNMWEIAAIVEALERKDLRTGQDFYDIMNEFRHTSTGVTVEVTQPCFSPEPQCVYRTDSSLIAELFRYPP